MKKFLIIALFALSMGASAQTQVKAPRTTTTKADTIAANAANISKVVTEESTSASGRTAKKYYFIYNGELVPTAKKTAEMYELAKKHGAKCGISIIKKGSSKRIILD